MLTTSLCYGKYTTIYCLLVVYYFNSRRTSSLIDCVPAGSCAWVAVRNTEDKETLKGADGLRC